MSICENVCYPCPLRTKVDVRIADEEIAWDDNGVQAKLSDGKNQYTAPLPQWLIRDSGEVYSAESAGQKIKETCKGPTEGPIQKECGIGLAKAWKWKELFGQWQPNVSGPEEIVPLFNDATVDDVFYDFNWRTYGLTEDRTERVVPSASSFQDIIAYKLTQKVKGTKNMLPKRTSVILDAVRDNESLYRIRVVHGGPHFLFETEPPLEDNKKKFYMKILAEGIHQFIHASPEQLEESMKRITAMDDNDYKRQWELNKSSNRTEKWVETQGNL